MKNAPLKFNKITKGSFNDQAYLDAFLKDGTFPKIHDQVAHVIKTQTCENESAFDLGSCTGLLTVQAVKLGRSLCVGLEGNDLDYKRAVRIPQVIYRKIFINTDTLERFKFLLEKYSPTLIIARRVLPEIHHNDSKTLDLLPGLLYKNGVKKIILQGRVKVKNPKTPLFCTDREVEVFAGYYRETHRHLQTALLEAI